MKKIFTLLFSALVALTSTAQIEITKDGKVVKDGDTIEFFAEEFDFGEGIPVMVDCAPNEPMVENKGAATPITITVEKADPTKDQLTWCMAMTGTCAPIDGPSKTISGNFDAGHKEGLALHAGEFTQGEYKTYTAYVTVKANGQTQKFTIKFIYDKEHATGIESTQADRVSVANKQLTYNFSSNADRQLNVYGVSGRLVKSEVLSQNGVVALNDLHRGVYIYEITADGKRTSAHKFVIK